jgi:hypothetical protein
MYKNSCGNGIASGYAISNPSYEPYNSLSLPVITLSINQREEKSGLYSLILRSSLEMIIDTGTLLW